MPIIGLHPSTPQPRLGFGASVSPLALSRAVDFSVKQDRSALEVIPGVAGLGALDLIDTVASSIPGVSSAIGIERGDINRAALNAIDAPGLGDFYHDYKGGIEATSGIAGIVASELLTRKFTAPASGFMKLLRAVPYARRIATLDEQYHNALATVRAIDMNLAAKGTLGIEQTVGRTVVDFQKWDSMAGQFVKARAELGRRPAFFRATGLGAAKNIAHAGVTESIMALTLNQNGFLYDDDAAYNMAWMGLGLAVAGSAGWLQGAYHIRKFVNSNEIRRTFANALDPEGFEESRLLWHGKKVKASEQASFLGGVYSDRVTSLAVGSRMLTESSDATGVEAQQLFANRERLATQNEQLAQEELQKLTIRGISSNGYTRFSLDALGYGNHAKMTLRRDPAAFFGVEQMGGIADDMNIRAVHESHMERLQERIDQTEEQIGQLVSEAGDPRDLDELGALARRLDYETTLTPEAIIDGELMPLSEGEVFAGWVEPDIRFTADDKIVKGSVKGSVKDSVKGDPHGFFEVKTENPKGAVSLDTGFVYHIPGVKGGINKADIFDVLRLYRLANKAVERMARFKGSLVVPTRPDWFQLDMAEHLLRTTDGRANVVFPQGMTRESARIESLIQKSKAVEQWDKVEAKKALAEESKGRTYEGQLSQLRLRYNLPKLSAYERGLLADGADHPVMSLLRGIAAIPETEIRKMSLQDIRKAMAEFKRVGDLAPIQKSDLDDFGSSFRFMMDENGNTVKPLLVYKRPYQVATWTKEHLAERLAAAKMWSVHRLTDPDAAPMSSAITRSLLENPDFDAASRTHELLETQIQGGLVGAPNQSITGSAANALRSSEQRDRDSIVLLGASRLRENVSRQARDWMKTIIEGAFQGKLTQLSNPRNAASKLLLEQFHTFRPGWDLADAPIKMRDGKWGFWLRPTRENMERYQTMFGRELGEKGDVLLSPSGKAVVLDDLGLDIQQRFNQVTTHLRSEKNTLLRANSRKEIQHVNWYVPSPNTNGKYIGFTFGPDNKVVSHLSVIASNEAEFKEAQRRVLERIENLGPGYTFRTQESIREFANIWDKAQMEFINPGTTAIQPGKRATGKLVGQTVRLNALEESLKNLQDSFISHGQDVLETLMRDPIKSAQARAMIATEVTKNRGRAGFDVRGKNIHEIYLENLLGQSKLNQTSAVGRVYRSIEGTIDKYLSEATPPVARVWHAVNEWIDRRKVWSHDSQARKDFDVLSKKLGQYMPFESALELAEARGYGAAPPTLSKLAGAINHFTAATVLRVAETIHPLMNLSGIVMAAPPVIRHYMPMRGETMDEFAKRIGHSATIFQYPDGRTLGILDMNKLITRGFKRAWDRKSLPDYDYMVRRGFLSQEVAEFHKQFSVIDSPGTFRAFFEGKPGSKGLYEKGVIGWTSILSDRSEDFSRSWGHMVGLELADELGITTREAKHEFAHDLANKMIANYSPHNRMEIFQGALGAPLGLFQSFIVNYYQRLFRYIETADYRALASQMTTQAGLFGVNSLPGWQQYNAFMTQDDGSGDPQSSIWRRFGGNAGDLIGHGLLSSLPTLFGLPAADLYSRGDVSIRQFTIQDPTSIPGILRSTTPAFNVMEKLWNGIGEGIALFHDTNPSLSMTQVGEVLSNAIANRPISGFIEQYIGSGNDTDARGQIVSDTKNMMESHYRLLGIRSMRQSNELQAFYANKNAQAHQAALKEELSLHTRQLIRAKEFDKLPEVFESYIKQGGDPRNFRRWLKSSYVAATSTRGQRMLEQVAKDPQKFGQMLRLLDAGVTIQDDENTPDTNQLYTVNEPEQ